MGIALGLGIIVGARAGDAGLLLAASGAAAVLVGIAVLLGSSGRTICLLGALGCLAGAACGALRHSEEPPLASMPAGTLAAVVASDPAVTERGAFAALRWEDAAGDERTTDALLPPAPSVERADRVEVVLHPESSDPELFTAASLRVTRPAGGLTARRNAVRAYIDAALARHVPGAPGALAQGLLIGDDSALPAPRRDELRAAGLSHITAVSGWNVTLVTGSIGALFLALGLRGWRWSVLQLAGLLAFVWIVGLDPPVVRAALMGVSALVALRLGRPAHTTTALVLAAAGMVAVSPPALESLSFRLSVLATIGIVAAAQLTRHASGWTRVIVAPALTSVCAGLATAPLLAAEFGSATPAALPANVIAGSLVPLATVTAVAVIPLSAIAPLGDLAGSQAWVANGAILALAGWFAEAPLGQWRFAPLDSGASAMLHLWLFAGVALALPEGRFLVRRLGGWSLREPASALAAGAAASLALGLALVAG